MGRGSNLGRLPSLLSVVGLASLAPMGLAAHANQAGVPALYATRAEAEEAARKHFNCTGAHAMGQQWMPCARHGPSSGSAPNHH